MDGVKRERGLVTPGAWLSGVRPPPPQFSTWGWTWRLTARWVATLTMTMLGVVLLVAGIPPGTDALLDLLLWGSGWAYSVLVTTLITIAFLRRPGSPRAASSR
ncbi:MAG: hypothetical protein AAGC66_01020 [Leifsonia sp.]